MYFLLPPCVLPAHFIFFDLITLTILTAFRGVEPIRTKICINYGIMEQINTFNYLEYNISSKGENELNIKIVNFVRLLVIINHTFKASFIGIQKYESC
jgi:hypothetical protein